MATSTLKSTAITNLDTIPVLAPTAGEGGKDYLREIDGYVTTLAADSTTSVYQIVRVATNVKVKAVLLDCAAITGASVNVGVKYSDAPVSGVIDGTPQSLAGTAIASPAPTFFAAAQSVASALSHSDITNQSGNYPVTLRNQPLWQAIGLSADPGGYFDIYAQPSTAGTAGGVLGLTVEFCGA